MNNTISAFEYVTVFISIILGLGVTQILTGIADLIHQNERVKIYWPHLVWVLLVLVLHVLDWWVTFQLRNLPQWRFPMFLFVLLYPVVLFILARLLFPFGFSEGSINLKKFYFENYRRIFLFGAMLAFLSVLDTLFISEFDPMGLIAESLVFVFLSLMAILKNSKPWLHQSVALFMLFLMMLSIAVEWDKWLVAN
jgi:hypothetical protein